MKWVKINFIMTIDIYNDIKDYLNGNIFHLKNYKQSIIIDNYKIEIEIPESIHSDFSYKTLTINFFIYNKKGTLVNKDFRYITSMDNLMLIICIPSKNNKIKFLINVDIDSFKTVKSATNKLKILKYKVEDTQYIRDSFLFANLKNKEDLIKICYLLIANSIKRGDLFESFNTIIEKFNYYGYAKKSHITNDSYYNLKSSQEIIETAIQKILRDMDNYTFKEECSLTDIKIAERLASDIYKSYINLLYKEGVLSMVL